jgi:isopenicillin-N epimerase
MAHLKEQFLLDPNIVFLNHGSFGATPKPVFDVYQAWQRELERQPVEFLGRRATELLAGSRAVLADYLDTQRDNLVYVTNTTVGVNIVARSLRLGPGDAVLATDHEYGACDRTWRFLAQKQGFSYNNQPISVPLTTEKDFIEQFWHGVTPRTRLIFISHLTSPTASIFPVNEVCRLARTQGLLTLVDGAHAPGQIPLNLEKVGADFYTGNLHKWLSSPKGAGFLYARPDVQTLLEPLIVSWGWQSEMPGPSQFVDQFEWQGTRDLAAFLSVPVAIQFQKENDWEKVREVCHALAVEAEGRICALTGLASLYSDDTWFAQMFSARLPVETDIVALKSRLYEDFRVEVPLMEWNGYKLIRVSVQGYNTHQDIEHLLLALKAEL